MSRYLVVAHQTAASSELIDHLTRIAEHDREAVFTVLIPATEPAHLLVWEAGDAETIAQRCAAHARAVLTQAGLHVVETRIGSADPQDAIAEEIRHCPGTHDAVVLCTLPPGISRWIGLEPFDAGDSIAVPVQHVVAGKAYR